LEPKSTLVVPEVWGVIGAQNLEPEQAALRPLLLEDPERGADAYVAA
jgi:hypothetical protein